MTTYAPVLCISSTLHLQFILFFEVFSIFVFFLYIFGLRIRAPPNLSNEGRSRFKGIPPQKRQCGWVQEHSVFHMWILIYNFWDLVNSLRSSSTEQSGIDPVHVIFTQRRKQQQSSDGICVYRI